MYMKESFHELGWGGVGVENNNYRFLSLHSPPNRLLKMDVGAYCNYFTKIGAKPADSPTSATVCLSVFSFSLPFKPSLWLSQTHNCVSAAGYAVNIYAII